MALSPPITFFLKWFKKLILILSVFVALTVLFVSLVLFFLPDVVSSGKFKHLLEKQLSTALDRPVDIKQLKWSWKDGIKIVGLEIPDIPEFSDMSMIFLKSAGLEINFRDLLHRKLNLRFLMSDLNIQIIKNPDGRINIAQLGDKKPSDPANKKKKEKKKKREKKADPFVLPVDVLSVIRFENITVTFDDQPANRKYIIQNAVIELKTASIKHSPLTLSIDLDLVVDKKQLPHSSLYATFNHVFDKNGALDIDGLSADLDIDLPGILAKISGDMSTSGINGDIKINLESLLTALEPFLPDSFKQSDISGAVDFSAKLKGMPDDPVTFNTKLIASDLAISGKIINQKALGPGKIEIALNGKIDLKDERLELTSGDITILENSHIRVHGIVDQFKSESRHIDMSVAPLYVDVSEVASFIKPFMPKTLALNNIEPSSISIDKLKVAGSLPVGNTDISISELDVRLAGIKLYPEKNTEPSMIINGIQISIETLQARLTDLFPISASLAASLKIDSLVNRNKAGVIAITGIHLKQLKADADNIKKAAQSKLGIEAAVSLENQLTVKQISISDQLKIDSLTQSLLTRATLHSDGSVNGTLEHLTIETPQLSFKHKEFDPLTTGCAINLSLNELNLKKFNPLLIDINQFIAQLNIEDALSFELNVNAEDTGNSWVTADGEITADLAGLTKKIPPEWLAGISCAGNARVTLKASGRVPKTTEIESLKTRHLEKNLDFIDTINIGMWLDKAKISLAQQDKSDITVGSITGTPLFEYHLTGKTGKGKLNSRILLSDFKGLPAIAPQKPILLELMLSGNHDYINSIDLHQALTIDPIGITENINFTIDGLNRVVTRNPMPEIPMWISDAGGKITAGINIQDCSLLQDLGLPGMSGLNLDGKIFAQIELTVVPDNSIIGNIGINVSNMNMAIKDSINAESIYANINLSKSYQIQSNSLFESTIAGPSMLSANIIQAAIQGTPASGNTDIYRHIRHINEQMNPDPAITFEKADILSGPFPLTIGESQIMLGLTNGLPNLDYFQFDLLGGTINGSLNIFKEQNDFFINANLNFSGINTAEIFPDAFSRKKKSEAKISGSLYTNIPVTDQLHPILENSTIIIEFSRIGSSALERLLYALDPHESNEAILSQRRLLKTGSPKWIRLEIKEGFLSLRGKISIQSIDIDLPRIRRLNIARLPGIDNFGDKLAVLKPIIRILKKLSAEKLILNKKDSTIAFE